MKKTMMLGAILSALTSGAVAVADDAHPFYGDDNGERGDYRRDNDGRGGWRGEHRMRPRLEWARLGEVQPGDWRNGNTLAVSAGGPVTRIVLRAEDAPMRVQSVKVEFGNGECETFDVSEWLRPGENSQGIDLPGDARFVRSVEVTTGRGWGRHRRWGRGDQGGRLAVWAQVVTRRHPRPNW